MNAEKNTSPGQLFPVGKKLGKLVEKNTIPGDFLYKFGQKWKISATKSGNMRGRSAFPKT